MLDHARIDSPSADARLNDGQRKAALALVEAILPGGEGIPAADERTLRDTAAVIERISPWAMRAFKGAVTICDRAAILSTGKRFAQLDRHRQQLLLERWDTDPVMRSPLGILAALFKFTHFDTREVYESLGGRLNVVETMEQPRWLAQIVDAVTHDETLVECDVVVVGTGAGGAVVGKELAERGHAVVFVEEGAHRRRDEFTGSSIQAHFDLYRGSFTVGNALMPIFMGKLVGGSTAINTGSCFRAPDWVLDRWCEDIGTDELSAERMAPYFARVERTLEVAPADEKAVGPIAQMIARGCDAYGWSHARMMRNAPGCQGEGFCDFGCRTDARKSTNLSYIPPALERGSIAFTGFRATEVIIENGRARGIRGLDANGRVLSVRANVVVFSGGALPTPVFLMKHGLCNSSGELGKNLTVHPSTGFSALMPEEINAHKHIPQGYFVSEFIRDGILINSALPDKNFAAVMFSFTGQRLMRAVEQSHRFASFGPMIADTNTGSVHPGPGGMPIARYSLDRAGVARMHRALILTGRLCWASGATAVFPVNTRMPIVESESDWAKFEALDLRASDLQLTSYHPLGTAKMGRDRKNSVVGLDHQTHDVPGLYLVDGSTVPGPLGVNPQVTIMAMATRAAEKIDERM